MIATDFIAAAAQPVVSVTVTLNCTNPVAPARNVMLLVPAPDVIVPLVIPQAYVAPAPADGTEAFRPPAFGHAAEGAVIAAEGTGLTATVVVPAAEAQPLTVTVTL